MKIKKSVVHEEFLLNKYRHGVQLIRPSDNQIQKIYPSQNINPNLIVGNILKLDFNVYFLNTNSVVLNMSEANARLIGSNSIKDAIGKTAFSFLRNKKDAILTISNDLLVMKSALTQTLTESAVHQNGQQYSYISIKSPWFDLDDKIIGVFGCSIPIGIANFSNYFSQITELGLLSPTKFNSPKYLIHSKSMGTNYLTDREVEILYHLIRGKTLKTIATFLNISPRTVEQHLENIKLKLNVSSKSEVIDKTIDFFFTDNQ